MFADLPEPWQACLRLAWEAYCEDCIPIGAVVTGPDGGILTRGRNRIYEKVKPGGTNGAALAHAEVEALRGLDLDALDPHECCLVTTTEPCPMCMGTLYMSGVRSVHYLARDPYAGSTNLLGTTWYLSLKPIRMAGPEPVLEDVVTALLAEQDAHIHNQKFPAGLFWDKYQEAIPGGVELGLELARRGTLQELRKKGARAEVVMDSMLSLVKYTQGFLDPKLEHHV